MPRRALGAVNMVLTRLTVYRRLYNRRKEMYLSLAAIYENLVVFRLLLLIHTISFLITNFSNSILYYSSGWHPWFVCLCVIGGGKNDEQVDEFFF